MFTHIVLNIQCDFKRFVFSIVLFREDIDVEVLLWEGLLLEREVDVGGEKSGGWLEVCFQRQVEELTFLDVFDSTDFVRELSWLLKGLWEHGGGGDLVRHALHFDLIHYLHPLNQVEDALLLSLAVCSFVSFYLKHYLVSSQLFKFSNRRCESSCIIALSKLDMGCGINDLVLRCYQWYLYILNSWGNGKTQHVYQFKL